MHPVLPQGIKTSAQVHNAYGHKWLFSFVYFSKNVYFAVFHVLCHLQIILLSLYALLILFIYVLVQEIFLSVYYLSNTVRGIRSITVQILQCHANA